MILDALWTGVVNDWESEARHARFLDQAHQSGALLDAAKRYGALRDDVERGPAARKRLAAIAMLATQVMLATQTERPVKRTPTWLVTMTVVVCLLLLGFASYFFLRGMPPS